MRFIFYRFVAMILLILLCPLFAVLFILVRLSSKGPFIFKQNRVGKRGNIFTIYKIRTMINNADRLQSKYKHLNEAKGPAFKISNDPRFTTVGKLISRFSLDELPQLLNIIKGEMSFVGPRPLPTDETAAIPLKYKPRFNVKPGLTSPWVVEGHHNLTFNQWMELDISYVNNNSLFIDLLIIMQTLSYVVNYYLKNY